MKNRKCWNMSNEIPISGIDEKRMKEMVSMVIGRNVTKIDLTTAAEYKGCMEAIWALRKVTPIKIDGKEVSNDAFGEYCAQISESLSLAFRNAYGIPQFYITESWQTPGAEYLFAVTEVEFYEDRCFLSGYAKDKETKAEREYGICLFLNTLELYYSEKQSRNLSHRVYLSSFDMDNKILSTIQKCAYKYVKKANEVCLNKLTEFLTGLNISKPGRQMFIALNKELQNGDNNEERSNVINNTVETAFHLYVHSSIEKTSGTFSLKDEIGEFTLTSMEKHKPCKDKKGILFEGIRQYKESPQKYRMTVEYDYQKNTLNIYAEHQEKTITNLTWNGNTENDNIIRRFRRCINSYYNAIPLKNQWTISSQP